MIPKTYKEVIDLGDGRSISIETGKLAKQAHGSGQGEFPEKMLRGTNIAFLTARCSQNEQGAREGLHKILLSFIAKARLNMTSQRCLWRCLLRS